MSSNKFRQKNPKNKKTKFHLIFDDENRREFLTGFQKRKKERKRVALEQQELKYKEEKQRIRQENRKAKLASWKDLNFPDEQVVEEDKEPIVYDHPEHTVTVESVGGVTVEQMDLHAAHGGIGENQVEYDDDDDDDDDDDGVQSRLKGLARYDDNESSDEEEDAVQDAPGGDKNSHPKKKSVNLQKLKSKLVKGKSGRKGSFVKQNGVSKKVAKGPRGHLGGRGGKRGKKGGGRGSGRGRKRNF